jgi:hypothetical protein
VKYTAYLRVSEAPVETYPQAVRVDIDEDGLLLLQRLQKILENEDLDSLTKQLSPSVKGIRATWLSELPDDCEEDTQEIDLLYSKTSGGDDIDVSHINVLDRGLTVSCYTKYGGDNKFESEWLELNEVEAALAEKEVLG